MDKSINVHQTSWGENYPSIHAPSLYLLTAQVYIAEPIYLGEYFTNDTRHEVNVYYLAPDSHKLEVVHVFEPGAIRHIHGLHFDPYEKHVWVVTGDRGSECRILRTKDHFKTLEVVGQGD